MNTVFPLKSLRAITKRVRADRKAEFVRDVKRQFREFVLGGAEQAARDGDTRWSVMKKTGQTAPGEQLIARIEAYRACPGWKKATETRTLTKAFGVPTSAYVVVEKIDGARLDSLGVHLDWQKQFSAQTTTSKPPLTGAVAK